MNSLNVIFGADSHPAIKFAVIFFLVAIGVFLLWFIVSKILKSMKRGGFSSRSRQPRLGILDEIEVDSERRLLLIRRDNVEHLLMVGGKNDFVIEQNITRALQQSPLAQVPVQQAPVYLQPVEQVEELPPVTNFKVAAKAQARAAAQVQEPEPVVEIVEPAIQAPKPSYADAVTNAFKNPPVVRQPLQEVNPFNTTKPAPVEPPKPAYVAPVARTQPAPSQTTFDSLEDEMALLLGQIKHK
jgi:flagellar protein FliO/FliZ